MILSSKLYSTLKLFLIKGAYDAKWYKNNIILLLNVKITLKLN